MWIVGSGGLLGGGLRLAAAAGHELYSPPPVDWSGASASALLADAARSFATRAAGRPWVLAWSAGAGVIGTDEHALRAETHLLGTLLQNLPSGRDGVVFLASSAGGAYGGVTRIPIDETAPDAPLSEYGSNKLVQESMVKHWVEANASRGIVGRISNLYGPGQSMAKRQGLISQVCLATLTRQPISIYVSMDTIRDYIFADDCGHVVDAAIGRAGSLDPGSCVTKIIASSRSISIGGILAETRRVLRRRPTTVMVPSDQSQMQGSVLSFRSIVWSDLDERALTTLPEGIEKTSRGIRAMLGDSGLNFPALE